MASQDDILTSIQNAVVALNNLAQVTNQARNGVLLPVSTVANLPAASAYQGSIRLVTDANATTRLAVVAGGGANIVPVFSDGTNWLID